MRIFKSQRGVSLIETMVALSLFALTASAVGTFLTSQIRAASRNNLITIAYGLAEDELEDLRALDYEDMVSRTATKTSGNVTFTTTTTVTANNPSANMKLIVVQLAWTENTGVKNVTVSTVYSQVRR